MGEDNIRMLRRIEGLSNFLDFRNPRVVQLENRRLLLRRPFYSVIKGHSVPDTLPYILIRRRTYSGELVLG